MNRPKKPLYRKVNTRARGVHHQFGKDFKTVRHKKQETKAQLTGSMVRQRQRGLDYTPLFQFLLANVGKQWHAVYSEAVSRLDQADPIFWMVAAEGEPQQEYVRVGESTFFSGLYVSEEGTLELVNPKLHVEDLHPSCKCCTHTLNGKVIPWKGN